MSKPPIPGAGKKEEKHPNHERWVISYADLLTLLLAVFVVLYASSTRNKHKEDEITKAFIKAFHGAPLPIVTKPSGSMGILHNQPALIPKTVESPRSAASKLPKNLEHQLSQAMKTLQALQLKLSALFQPMIDKHQVSMTSTPLTLTIQLDASVLFDSGDDTLRPEAATLLKKVAAGLTNLPPQYRIVVQGYTDNKPISTPKFPSNWSLSAERAVSVVALFRDAGVSGDQLAAEGFGEFAPIASNKTEAGRAQNRRVVVVVRAPAPNVKEH